MAASRVIGGLEADAATVGRDAVAAIAGFPPPVQDSCMRDTPSLDDLDRLLLGLVQRDARRPLHELGEQVGLSPSAVQRRLTRMRRSGVVRADVAVVDPEAVGAGLTSLVLVALADDDPEHHAAFRERMRTEACVQQCYAIVGQWDYAVLLVTRDIAQNRQVSRRLFVTDFGVRRYETFPASEAVKAGLTVPLG